MDSLITERNHSKNPELISRANPEKTRFSLYTRNFLLRHMNESKVIWSVMLLLAVAMFTLGMAVYPVFQQYTIQNKEVRSVLLELRVVDAGGHPVSGASVYVKNLPAGRTDAFGKWEKRYRQYAPEMVAIGIKRHADQRTFDVLKNLALNSSKKHEISEDSRTKRRRVVLRLSAVDPDASDRGKPGHVTRAGIARNPETAQAQRAELPKSASESGLPETIWFNVLSAREGIRETMILKKYLVPALNRAAATIGLQPRRSSPFQVSLMHIPPDVVLRDSFRGIIHVVARPPESSQAIEFLRNYTGNSRLTAAGILRVLRQHMPGKYQLQLTNNQWRVKNPRAGFWQLEPGDWLRSPTGQVFEVKKNKEGSLFFKAGVQAPCGAGVSSCFGSKTHLPEDPPNLRWRSVNRVIAGIPTKNSTIFFGGFRARLAGKNLWQFWARSGYSGYLSVIQNGKIVYRQLVDGRENLPVVARSSDINNGGAKKDQGRGRVLQ